MLTRHFLQQSALQLGVDPKRISDAALVWLGHFGFPGNVRQLENICHWLTVMAPAQMVEPKDLPPEVGVEAHARGEVAASSTSVPVPPLIDASTELQQWPESGVPGLSGGGLSGKGVQPAPFSSSIAGVSGWELGLEADAVALLASGRTDVWDELTRRFESRLIQAALTATRGRRIEAAQKLGIGRNTITRKIQELGLE